MNMKIDAVLISCACVFIAAHTKPILSDDVPATVQSDKSKEEVSQMLFGERGVLTGIFRMMDQQRKIKPAVQQDTADNGKIGNFDFKKIVDTLVTGAAEKGELGDHGVELPEILGICNRLSCGDIYKVIDKFRKSEMFSNFQTALTLVNDPNGWETIGKLLSNPELIAQFTAGTGMEELFGSALGEAKNQSSIAGKKNSGLMPEDGDFGIDFSEDGSGQNVTTEEGKDKNPNVEFSVDMKGGEDYYSEVSKGGDESTEYEFVDSAPPPSTKIEKSVEPSELKEKLPPISFSIDGGGEDNESETVVTAELPPTNPKVLKRIHAGSTVERKIDILTTRSASTIPSTTISPILSSSATTTTTRVWTTTRSTTTTTARNFRKDSDYYVMYYDDGDKL